MATAIAPLPAAFPKGPNETGRRGLVARGAATVWEFLKLMGRIISMLFLLGFALLPISVLLLWLPAWSSGESVLKDTQGNTNYFRRQLRRAAAFITGLVSLIALLTISVQVVTWLGLKSEYFGRASKSLFSIDLAEKLPQALIEGWPFVLLLMYVLDIVILIRLGKVPVSYNLRNLRVRWVTTGMTVVAFTVVVGLLIVMMGFIDSVNRLTSSSGIPSNIFILSEGATDELFSNLAYGDMGKLDNWQATYDKNLKPLPTAVTPGTLPGKKGDSPRALVSKETYFVVAQQIPNPTGQQKTRFVQLRGIDDAEVGGKVHGIDLLEGEWFGREGAITIKDGKTAVPCVVGLSAARTFGADLGKDRLTLGDTFILGKLTMVVVGIMKADNSTFASETWATNARVSQEFGKKSFTTCVMRVEPATADAAEAMAKHLTEEFANPRLRAVTEPRYYEDLGKSNSQILFMVIVIGVIMALGGIIGIMLVMFAAIAQRIKDVGVLRVLGYSRWQVLVSFMLESLAIALIGGFLACFAIGFGQTVASALGMPLAITSNISSGQGGGKAVVTKLIFGLDIYVCGLLFSMVMGRLGGLIPSVGAMRMGILESLR
jgi:putative ABC transport system permease protein